MAYLSVSLMKSLEYPDPEDESLCVLACKDGQIAVYKRVLRAGSDFWKQKLLADAQPQHHPMTSLAVDAVERVVKLLRDGHLILRTQDATRFFFDMDQLDVTLCTIVRPLARVKATAPGYLSLAPTPASSQTETTASTSTATTSSPDPLPSVTSPIASRTQTVNHLRPFPRSILKTVDGRKYCNICKKVFASRKHYYVHFPGRYQCKECDRIYGRSDNLNFHMKIVHPNFSISREDKLQ